MGENDKTITGKLQQARSCDKAAQIINFTNIFSFFTFFFRCEMIFTCYLFSVYIVYFIYILYSWYFQCFVVVVVFFTFKDQNLAENLNTLAENVIKKVGYRVTHRTRFFQLCLYAKSTNLPSTTINAAMLKLIKHFLFLLTKIKIEDVINKGDILLNIQLSTKSLVRHSGY